MAAGKGISPLRNFYGRTPASGRKTGRHSGSAVHARVAALRGGAGASPKGGTPARRSLTQHAASSDPNKSAALMCIHAPRRWADVVKQGVPRTSSTCVQKRVAATAHRRRKFKNIVAASTGLCTPRVQTASTGHANSPATIVVGRSRVRKSTPSPNLSQFATPSIPTDVFVSPLSVTQEGGEEPVAGGSSARKSSLSTRTKPAKRSPSHKADYRDVRGVKRMFAKTSPASDFTDVGGVKRIFGKRSPAADYTDVTGVKRIFARASSSAGGDYAAVSPVARLFQTPVEGAPAPREGQSSAKGGEHRGSLSPVPRGTRRSQGLAKRQSSASSAGKEELPPSKRLRTQSPRGGGANVSSPQKEEKPPSSPQRLPVKETRRSSRKSGSLGGRRSPGKSPQKEVVPPRSPSKNSTLTRSPLGSKTPQEERQPAGAQLRTRTSSPTRLPQRGTTRVSPARSPRKPASPERRPPAKTPSPTRSPRRATASRPSPVKTGSPSPSSKSPGPKSSVAAGREGKEAASPKGVQAGKAGASVQVQAQVLLAEAVAPAKPAKRSTPASTRGRAAVTTRTSAQDKSATPSETPVRRSGRGEEKTPVKRSARGKAGTPAEATGSSVKKSAGRSTGRTPAEAAATPGRRATRRAKAKEAAEAPTTPVKRGARGKKPAKEAPSSPRDAVVDAPAPAKEAPSSPRKVLADSPAPVKSTRGARRKASAEQETGSAVPAKSPPRRRAVRGAAKAVASSASSTPKKRTRGLAPTSSQSPVSPVNPAQDEEEKPAAKLATKSPLRGGKRQVTRRGGKQAEHPSSPPKAPAEEADLPATRQASRRRAASKKHPSSPPKATAEEADLSATPPSSKASGCIQGASKFASKSNSGKG
ncbi:neurofilament heavy polypeptide-like [Ornithodoros turicata]|uniref:neurofilament heavy polypeptide-like n=1 Tax=Ornithodoros turicata TaxID=34597 RepID=UPI0031395703